MQNWADVKTTIKHSTRIKRTARVAMVEGMFDLGKNKERHFDFDVEMPLSQKPWSIGLIVGPSGSGKSTIIKDIFNYRDELYKWSMDRTILDDFDKKMNMKDICGILSHIGFSSPPSWLTPFNKLSNGEKFRVEIARKIIDSLLSKKTLIVDEFTSVVDRTVAKTASYAISKTVRKNEIQMIAASCHYDIIDWLDPDWVFDCSKYSFSWRSLRGRPKIELRISRITRDAWKIFGHHHYLSTKISDKSKCFIATWNDIPVAFTAVVPDMGRRRQFREHRTVCLPDFQGVGIGNIMSDMIGSIITGGGYGYVSVTSNPTMIYARKRRNNWKSGKPKFMKPPNSSILRLKNISSSHRMTCSFKYYGEKMNRRESTELILEKL